MVLSGINFRRAQHEYRKDYALLSSSKSIRRRGGGVTQSKILIVTAIIVFGIFVFRLAVRRLGAKHFYMGPTK